MSELQSTALLDPHQPDHETPRQVLLDEDPPDKVEDGADKTARINALQAEQEREAEAAETTRIKQRLKEIQDELAALYKTGQNTAETLIPLETEEAQLRERLAQQPQLPAGAPILQKKSQKGLFANDSFYQFLKGGLTEIRNGFKEVRADIRAGNTLRAMQKEQGLPVTSRWNMFWKMRPSDIQRQIASIQSAKTQNLSSRVTAPTATS